MSIKRIRAVDRALQVIGVLSQSGSCTLTELRQKTGLDNAGLLRILGTMIDRGWVRQLIVEKRYELSHSLGDILGAEARAHPMAESAMPILLELRQNPYSLPSDLCAIRGFGQFEIIESRRQRGYGIREEMYWEPPFDETPPPIRAIAVPIITEDGIHGSLSLLWLEEHLSADTVIRSGLLERLKASARDISTKLTEGSIPPPD